MYRYARAVWGAPPSSKRHANSVGGARENFYEGREKRQGLSLEGIKIFIQARVVDFMILRVVRVMRDERRGETL